MLWGKHCLKMWSSTQATVALSSAEAELYALTKGAAQGLGMTALLHDFGVAVSVTVHTDASAKRGSVSSGISTSDTCGSRIGRGQARTLLLQRFPALTIPRTLSRSTSTRRRRSDT